jgi:Polysaccharide deacetylase
VKETGGNKTSVIRLFVLILVFSLLSGGVFNSNYMIGAFARKNKTSSSGGKNNIHGGTKQEGEGGTNTDTASAVTTTSNNKFVILNFDDSHQSDYTYAKPILDKYGFKATFFEVCNWVELHGNR